MGTIIDKLLGGGINAIADGLDKVITTKKEMQQLLNELEELKVRDRESAREMYQADSAHCRRFLL